MTTTETAQASPSQAATPTGETSSVRRIYLAGPEVFLPNARQLGAQKKALCEQYGFEGLFPLDSELSEQALAGSPQELGFAISAANEDLIRHCDVLIANLTPFRGPSADVGTVYELGLARGLAKAVHGYCNCAQPFLQRTWHHWGPGSQQDSHQNSHLEAGDVRDRDGLKIEEFGLHDNLMIQGGIRWSDGLFWIPQSNPEEPLNSQSPAQQIADLKGFEWILKTLSNR